MKKEWSDIVITEISAAVFVPPDMNMKKHVHRNRQFHGFVLGNKEGIKDYCFSDGRVMRTEGEMLYYLPKNSSYEVKIIRPSGCYAINFDADIEDEPFAVSLRNAESLKKSFRAACSERYSEDKFRIPSAKRAIYDAIYRIYKETEESYMAPKQEEMIMPAIEEINRALTDKRLSVERLAKLCGISEVYFRKIFLHRFGVSPKEYIIDKRMEYARQLLAMGDFGVTEIAENCGYSEPCHFSREFKRKFGISPKYYK